MLTLYTFVCYSDSKWAQRRKRSELWKKTWNMLHFQTYFTWKYVMKKNTNLWWIIVEVMWQTWPQRISIEIAFLNNAINIFLCVCTCDLSSFSWRVYDKCISQCASYRIRQIAGCACSGNAGNVYIDFTGNRGLTIPACITARALSDKKPMVCSKIHDLWNQLEWITRSLNDSFTLSNVIYHTRSNAINQPLYGMCICCDKTLHEEDH